MSDFDENIDYEQQEIQTRLLAEDRARQNLNSQYVAQYNQTMIQQGVSEACAEAGISPEDFSRMSGFDLEMTGAEIKNAAKSMVRGVVSKAKKGQKAPQAGTQPRQPGQPAQPVQASSDRRENLRNIDTKRREGRVSSDQALLDSLNSILPPDDEFWKYG